jgi:hypothetical protein
MALNLQALGGRSGRTAIGGVGGRWISGVLWIIIIVVIAYAQIKPGAPS